jgi:hypothetical protein
VYNTATACTKVHSLHQGGPAWSRCKLRLQQQCYQRLCQAVLSRLLCSCASEQQRTHPWRGSCHSSTPAVTLLSAAQARQEPLP